MITNYEDTLEEQAVDLSQPKIYFMKSMISMRYWLLGRKYLKAIEAMEFAASIQKGLRKDNETPEFQHPLSIAHFMRVYEPLLIYKEESFITMFLHDVMEDYDVGYQEIEQKFGSIVAQSVWLLTKKHRNEKKNIEHYYNEIANDPIASIGKGADRINNIQTSVDVFSPQGQLWYVEETEKYILPMLKNARRTFMVQEAVYENIKLILRNQIALIKKIHKEKGFNEK